MWSWVAQADPVCQHKSRKGVSAMSRSAPEVISAASEELASVSSARATMEKASAGTRGGLSHTREQLADRVPVWAPQPDLPVGVQDKWQAAKDTVAHKIGQVTQYVGAGKETIQDKTDKVTSQAKSLANQAQAQVPPPVARRVHHLTAAVRQRPVSVTAMVLTVIALVLLLPRVVRRSK